LAPEKKKEKEKKMEKEKKRKWKNVEKFEEIIAWKIRPFVKRFILP